MPAIIPAYAISGIFQQMLQSEFLFQWDATPVLRPWPCNSLLCTLPMACQCHTHKCDTGSPHPLFLLFWKGTNTVWHFGLENDVQQSIVLGFDFSHLLWISCALNLYARALSNVCYLQRILPNAIYSVLVMYWVCSTHTSLSSWAVLQNAMVFEEESRHREVSSCLQSRLCPLFLVMLYTSSMLHYFGPKPMS